MLLLDGKSFATGRSKFLDQNSAAPEQTAKIYVKIEFPGLPSTSSLAQLDTGAAYSMLELDLADALGVLNGSGEETTISTRGGPIKGRLERIPLTLIADEGDSMDIEATFFVSPAWREGTFLGYTGLLDHMRTALDPRWNFFYFGAE